VAQNECGFTLFLLLDIFLDQGQINMKYNPIGLLIVDYTDFIVHSTRSLANSSRVSKEYSAKSDH
jgi:hypothetical protein